MCVKCTGLCIEARLEVSLFFLQAFLLFFGKLYYSPAYKSVYKIILDVKTGRFVTVEGCFILFVQGPRHQTQLLIVY